MREDGQWASRVGANKARFNMLRKKLL